MSFTKIISHNTVVMILGRGVNLLISSFLVVLITRYLGVAGFGQYATIFSYILLFGVFADFGLHNTITRKIATRIASKDEIARFYILKIGLSLITYMVAVIIAWNLNYEIIVKVGITIFSLAGLASALYAFNSALYHGKLKVKEFVIADVIGRIAILILVYFSIKNNFGLLGILASYVVGDSVSYILSSFWLKKLSPFNTKIKFSRADLIAITKESFPLGIIMILTTVYFRSDIIILSLLKPSYDVGIYGAGVKIIDIFLSFPTVLMAVIYPVIAILSQEDRKSFNQKLQKIINFVVLIAFPTVVFGIIASSRIIRLVAGYNFVHSATTSFMGFSITTPIVLSILLVAVFFVFLHQIFTYVLIASGKQNVLFIPVLLYVLFNILLNIIFVPKFSYFASSIITLINEIIVFVVVYQLSKKIFRHKINFQIVSIALISIIPASLLLIFLNNLGSNTIYSVVWQLLLVIIIYLLLLNRFKVFKVKDLKKLF